MTACSVQNLVSKCQFPLKGTGTLWLIFWLRALDAQDEFGISSDARWLGNAQKLLEMCRECPGGQLEGTPICQQRTAEITSDRSGI